MEVRVQSLHKFNEIYFFIFLTFKKNFQIRFLLSVICNYINLSGDNAEVSLLSSSFHLFAANAKWLHGC